MSPISSAARRCRNGSPTCPSGAKQAHRAVGRIGAETDPADTILSGLAYIRNPNMPQQAMLGAPLMPGALGDSGQAFLSPTLTQYYFLTQWNDRKCSPSRSSRCRRATCWTRPR